MFAQRQIQLFAWSRRPIFFSASAWSTTFTPSRLSSRGQDSTKSSARSKASASRPDAISCSARSRSAGFLLRSTAVIRNVRLSSPPWSKCSIARARRQPVGATRSPARAAPPPPRARPLPLLAVVQMLDGDPPQLTLEDLDPPVLLGRDRKHPP